MANPLVQIRVTLRGKLAHALFREAARLDRRPNDLVNALIEKILADNLVDAVLDDDAERKNCEPV